MKQTIEQMTLIAKSSGLSIGLAVTLGVFIFWGGLRLGSLQAKQLAHEELATHKGVPELFVPKSEIELRFKAMEENIKEIKATQKEILQEVRK